MPTKVDTYPKQPIMSFVENTNADLRPMNDRDTKLFMGVYLSEMNALKQDMKKYVLWDKPKEAQLDKALTALLDGSMPAMVLFNRLGGAAPELKMTTQLFAWIALHCDRPGISVMWAHALYELWLMLPKEEVLTISFWAEQFPTGFPSDDFMHRCWESQKSNDRRGGNVLDQQEFWEWMRSRREKNNPGATSA